MQSLLIGIISVVVSAFGTIVGFGGGVFMVPILAICFKVPINMAVGSVIFALFPSAIISTFFNVKKNIIDYKLGIIMELPTMLGTVIGSMLTAVMPVFLLEILFGFFIILVGYNLGFKRKVIPGQSKNKLFGRLNQIGPVLESKSGTYHASYLALMLFGLLSGILAGLFGVGGGFMKVPIMIGVFNVPGATAAATALFMIVFTSLTGTVSHFALGHINPGFAVPIVTGFIVGALLGSNINAKLNERTLKKLIASGLILAGIAMFINTTL